MRKIDFKKLWNHFYLSESYVGEKSYLKDPPYMPKNKWGQEKHFLLYEAPFASYSQVKIEKSPKIWLRSKIVEEVGQITRTNLLLRKEKLISRENHWR